MRAASPRAAATRATVCRERAAAADRAAETAHRRRAARRTEPGRLDPVTAPSGPRRPRRTRSTLLEVENLKVHFPITPASAAQGRRRAAPSTASRFEIRRGETLGLVGESGCGKTTTGRAVIRLPSRPAARCGSTGRT